MPTPPSHARLRSVLRADRPRRARYGRSCLTTVALERHPWAAKRRPTATASAWRSGLFAADHWLATRPGSEAHVAALARPVAAQRCMVGENSAPRSLSFRRYASPEFPLEVAQTSGESGPKTVGIGPKFDRRSGPSMVELGQAWSSSGQTRPRVRAKIRGRNSRDLVDALGQMWN